MNISMENLYVDIWAGKDYYLGIEAVSCRLLLRDSKGAHGLNLEKKLSFFFFFRF